jgi:hypothetical protein
MEILLQPSKVQHEKGDYDGRIGVGKFIDVVSKAANRHECSAACRYLAINIYGSQKHSRLVLSTNGVDNTRRDIVTEKNMAKNYQFFVKICSKSEPDKR